MKCPRCNHDGPTVKKIFATLCGRCRLILYPFRGEPTECEWVPLGTWPDNMSVDEVRGLNLIKEALSKLM